MSKLDESELQLRRVEFKLGSPFYSQDRRGYFHTWTSEPVGDVDGSIRARAVAIIEMTDGELKLVDPAYFKFVRS